MGCCAGRRSRGWAPCHLLRSLAAATDWHGSRCPPAHLPAINVAVSQGLPLSPWLSWHAQLCSTAWGSRQKWLRRSAGVGQSTEACTAVQQPAGSHLRELLCVDVGAPEPDQVHISDQHIVAPVHSLPHDRRTAASPPQSSRWRSGRWARWHSPTWPGPVNRLGQGCHSRPVPGQHAIHVKARGLLLRM